MTIKALVYIEKSTFDYINILKSLIKISNLEINNFVYSENCIINFEGLTQINGTLVAAAQQTKCEAVLVFALSNQFIDNMSKLQMVEVRSYVILIPIIINIESLSRLSGVTVYTCLPLRHLTQVWKARSSLTKDEAILQYIEGSLVAPTLGRRHKSYGSQMDITINNFYRLIMVDLIQFISKRHLFKIQAHSRVVEWEMHEEHKNEKHLDDYSVIIGYFLPKESDSKSSATSKSGSRMLNPRVCLIKTRSSFLEPEEVSVKVKIQSSKGPGKVSVGKVKKENDGESVQKDENEVTFWKSKLVVEGIETFLRHVEHARQHHAPRLVDLGTLSDAEVIVAKNSLLSVADLRKLCHVVSTVDRACSSTQTVIVE